MSVLASIMPGITVDPWTSTGFTPDGTVTFAPTASMRLPLMTIVPFGMTGPETVTMRALVIAHVGPSALPFTSNFSAGGTGREGACDPFVPTCEPFAWLPFVPAGDPSVVERDPFSF